MVNGKLKVENYFRVYYLQFLIYLFHAEYAENIAEHAEIPAPCPVN